MAYRSYVAQIIIDKYPTKELFYKGIRELNLSMVQSTIVHSQKYKGKIKQIESNKSDIYDAIKYAERCTKTKDFGQEQNVLFVNQIVDLSLLFFNPDFINLSSKFSNIEQFVFHSVSYQRIRNDLSHPASSKIIVMEAKEVIIYVDKLMEVLNDKYFWFKSKKEISEFIDSFLDDVNTETLKVHNLNEIWGQHRRLIFREKELEHINKLIINDDEMFRRCGSLVVFGHGGVGKTALVIEFINRLIKDIRDKKISSPFGFILFFSSKAEILEFTKTTGELYINNVRKQINSFEDFINNLFTYLNIKNWNDESYDKETNGIIVIDNFESFENSDKDLIFDFIKNSPRNVSFILTSRNEERCEERIQLEEFTERNNGIDFINTFIEEYEMLVELSQEQKRKLVNATKGNTLILILALERINDGKKDFNSIMEELDNISSQNIEIIADFMYKNSFDQTINDLSSKNYAPIDILRIIALYNEPVDLFSISTLTDIAIREVEFVCNYLSTKLILEKVQELYSINDFANKFMFIKFMPDKMQLKLLSSKIEAHKRTIKDNLQLLEKSKDRNPLLKGIFQDWKPRNHIDQIAISEVFSIYNKAKQLTVNKNRLKQGEIKRELEDINNKFATYEVRTSHPYVRFQKARVYKLLMENGIEIESFKAIVKNYYEQTIYSVQFDYIYIKKTRSFAAVLWLYGIFLNKYVDDQTEAIKYLEESKNIFEELNIFDKNYYKMLSELCQCYLHKYKETRIPDYLEQSKQIYKLTENKYLPNYNVSSLSRFLEKLLKEAS